MPFGSKVVCVKCERQESVIWHPVEEGAQCNECMENEQLSLKVVEEEEQKPTVSVEKHKNSAKKTTRSTRSYKTRQNPNALPKQLTPKGKGRRQIFKKTTPVKLTAAKACYTTVTSVLYKGVFYRVGDIVSLQDEDGRNYYAQINGLMIDEYCEKSASITWLIPTYSTGPGFHPLKYTVGYDDDLPRTLDALQFVMHAPSEYFRNNRPLPSGLPLPGLTGFIYGRIAQMI